MACKLMRPSLNKKIKSANNKQKTMENSTKDHRCRTIIIPASCSFEYGIDSVQQAEGSNIHRRRTSSRTFLPHDYLSFRTMYNFVVRPAHMGKSVILHPPGPWKINARSLLAGCRKRATKEGGTMEGDEREMEQK